MVVGVDAVAVDEVAVHPQENFYRSKSHPLVAVNKRVVRAIAF